MTTDNYSDEYELADDFSEEDYLTALNLIDKLPPNEKGEGWEDWDIYR